MTFPTYTLYPMYQTEGVDAIATVTEIRMETAALIDAVNKSSRGIAIQRNNTPEAVLISWDLYRKLSKVVDFEDL